MKLFRVPKSRGRSAMATQMQPTPVLKGRDASAVIRELEKKPSTTQMRRVEERKDFFSNIGKRGLR
jgi:hypothetical protein